MSAVLKEVQARPCEFVTVREKGMTLKLPITGGFMAIESTGLDGVTRAKSYQVARHPARLNELVIVDDHKNAIVVSVDRLFVTLGLLAPQYKIERTTRSD